MGLPEAKRRAKEIDDRTKAEQEAVRSLGGKPRADIEYLEPIIDRWLRRIMTSNEENWQSEGFTNHDEEWSTTDE